MRDRLGALLERPFRLLFLATASTALGDAVSLIALSFAVLETGSATDLGIVLATRTVVSGVVLIFGGVLSDRLPRNLVLVGASVLQGSAQLTLAVLVIGDGAGLGAFVGLSAVWGLGDGLVSPAEVALVRETISDQRLQEANALQGLVRSGVRVIGPALGGVLVVAVGPGWALAADALSFFVCAMLLAQIRLPRRAGPAEESYLDGLRGGWRAFTAQTWLWSTIALFTLGNMFWASWQVLGPAIAEARLGGAGAWALVLAVGGIGSVLGGAFAMRHRPARPLVACILWPLPMAGQLATLAAGAPLAVVVVGSLIGSFGITVHMTLWFTLFQRQVPPEAQSRVASYDALGSLALVPLGAAIAGPSAAAIGTSLTLWLAAGLLALVNLLLLAVPAVWTIGAEAPTERASGFQQ